MGIWYARLWGGQYTGDLMSLLVLSSFATISSFFFASMAAINLEKRLQSRVPIYGLWGFIFIPMVFGFEDLIEKVSLLAFFPFFWLSWPIGIENICTFLFDISLADTLRMPKEDEWPMFLQLLTGFTMSFASAFLVGLLFPDPSPSRLLGQERKD